MVTQTQNRPYPLALKIFLFFIIISITGCSLKQSGVFGVKSEDVFDQAVKLIEENYIDENGKPIKLNTSNRPDMTNLLSQMDSSATLFTQKEVKELTNPFTSTIDIELEKREDGFYITSNYGEDLNDSGLNINDKLLEIDNEPVSGLPMNKVIVKFFGAPDSELKIKVLNSNNEDKEIKIKRQSIERNPSVFEKYFNESRIGYLRISKFDDKASDKVKASLKRLLRKPIRGLIIDLRGNPGGLLNEVTDSCELFLRAGSPIVQVKGISADRSRTYFSGGWHHYTDFPIEVLIDKHTGSGAEAMAAALKYNNRAVLIGENTHGSNLVKGIFNLYDGSLLVFRSSFMLTTEGKPIEKDGVPPNLEIKIPEEKKSRVYQSIIKRFFYNEAEEFSDIQLDTAISYFDRGK